MKQHVFTIYSVTLKMGIKLSAAQRNVALADEQFPYTTLTRSRI